MTGATGVVGCRALPRLLRDGHEISAVVRSAAKAVEVEKAGGRPVTIDLFDRAALRTALAGHDVVVNLATHLPASSLRMLLPWAWHENDRIRSIGSANLVDAALTAGVTRFIQESFAPGYPDSGDAWIGEDTPLAPARYNRTTLDAEASARRFGEAGRKAVVLRFAAFYGPDAMQTRMMIDSVRRGYAPLPRADDAYISSSSHDDAASAVVAALRLPVGTYNVGDDEPLRRGEFVASLAAALNLQTPRPLPGWPTALSGSLGELMSRSVRISNRKLRGASDWQPSLASMREGWPAALLAVREQSWDLRRSRTREVEGDQAEQQRRTAMRISQRRAM